MMVQENAVQKPYHIVPEQMILSLFLHIQYMQVLFSVELIIFMAGLYGCLIKCKSGYSILPITREQTVLNRV